MRVKLKTARWGRPEDSVNRIRAVTTKIIVHKYARLSLNGKPIRCGIPRAEIEDRKRRKLPRLKPKIIFDTLEKAQMAEKELRANGSRRQRAYVCPRSGSGHAHLTSDAHPADFRRIRTPSAPAAHPHMEKR